MVTVDGSSSHAHSLLAKRALCIRGSSSLPSRSALAKQVFDRPMEGAVDEGPLAGRTGAASTPVPLPEGEAPSLATLPSELVLPILQQLDLSSVGQLTCASRLFCEAASDPEVSLRTSVATLTPPGIVNVEWD